MGAFEAVKQHRKHLAFALALICGAGVAGLSWGVRADAINGAVEDAILSSLSLSGPKTKIVIAEIGDSTLKAWPEPLALMGSRLASLTKNLREAGAKLVVFDFVHSAEPDGLLDAWGATVLPNSAWADELDQWPDGVVLGASTAKDGSLIPPAGDLLLSGTTSERLGAIDIAVPEAGVVRSIQLYEQSSGRLFPSLPLQALAASSKSTAEAEAAQKQLGPFLRLGRGHDWPSVKAEELGGPSLPPAAKQAVNGAVVIVAMTHSGSRDFHTRPGGSAVAGGWVVADAIEALSSGRMMREAPAWAGALICLAWAAVLAALCQRARLPHWAAAVLGLAAPLAAAWAGLGGMDLAAPYGLWAAAGLASPLAFALGSGISARLDKLELEEVFAQQLSPQVASHLLADPKARQLGGMEADCTVLVFDLRGFTAFSEKTGAEGTFAELNRIFSFVLPIVRQHDGIVVTLMGDGFLAVFGAPVPSSGHASQALAASMEIHRAMEQDKGELSFGIGLSSGPLLFGNLGSHDRRQFTMIADVVNLASRLQDECKNLGALIVADCGTLAQSDEEWPGLQESHKVKVRGRTDPIAVRCLPRAAPHPGTGEAGPGEDGKGAFGSVRA